MSIATAGAGRLLAERLGLTIAGTEGHDLKGPCIACDSSDAFRIHEDTGVAHCYACNGDWSPLRLAEKVLGEQAAAWGVLVDVGLEEPRNGHNGHANIAALNPLERVAREKRISTESLLAYGAKIEAGAVVLPMYGPNGKQCSTFSMRPGGAKGLCEAGKKSGLFFPGRLPKAGETWYAVEGPKDAAALHALGLNAFGMPTNHLAAKFGRLFAGVDVVFVPDRDEAGTEGAEKSAARLHKLAASIRVAVLPVEFKQSKGADVRDVLQKPDGRELVLQAIGDAKTWEPAIAPDVADRSHLPKILITEDEQAVADQAIESLKDDAEIYKRGGVLVQVIREEHKASRILRPHGCPHIVKLPLPKLRERLSARARYVSLKAAGDEWVEQPAHPPNWLYQAVDARGHWPTIRHLEGIVEAPTLRADGTILDVPGYDEATGLLYEPSGEFDRIPAQPSKDDAMLAAAVLLEVISDFPMKDAAHRSACLAGILTPMARFAFSGPAPLFAIEANVRGAGKSLLADVAAMIACGRAISRMANPGSEDETRKRITTVAIEGDLMVLLDNLTDTLGGAALDAALTGTTWKDRILGGNTSTRDVPLLATWYATGNNLVINGDTTRRCLHIRLESPLERPEERAGFRHPNLLEWIRQERPKLVAAALTILRSYCAAGRPSMRLKPWGSFEGWSDLVRNALAFAGQPDPADTREELLRDSDQEASALRALIAGWEELDPDGDGMTTAEVLAQLSENDADHRDPKSRMPLRWNTLRGALGELIQTKHGTLPSARSVAMKLHHLRGRIIGGKAFRSSPNKEGTAVWKVVEANAKRSESSGTTDTTDTTLANPTYAPARTRTNEPADNGRNSPCSPCSPGSLEIEERKAMREF